MQSLLVSLGIRFKKSYIETFEVAYTFQSVAYTHRNEWNMRPVYVRTRGAPRIEGPTASNEKQKILLFINLFFNTLFLFLIQLRRMHIYIFTPSNEEKKNIHEERKKRRCIVCMCVWYFIRIYIVGVHMCAPTRSEV